MNASQAKINQTSYLINDLIRGLHDIGATKNKYPDISMRKMSTLSDRRIARKILARAWQWYSSDGKNTHAKPRLIYLVYSYPQQTRDLINIIRTYVPIKPIKSRPKPASKNKRKSIRRKKRN